METIQDAKAAFEASGLVVAESSYLPSLLVGTSTRDVGDGVHIFENASVLKQRNDEWVVLLRAEGLTQYEVPGTLADGVALVLAVYADNRKNGGPFYDACKRVLKDADRHLIGASLTVV